LRRFPKLSIRSLLYLMSENQTNSLTNYSKVMAYQLSDAFKDYDNDSTFVYKRERGGEMKSTTECAYFVQKVTKAPLTQQWKKGTHVLTSTPGAIARGTAIATFKGEEYGGHAAIYISHTDNGITVWGQ